MDDALYSKVINIAASVLTGAAVLIAGAGKSDAAGQIVGTANLASQCVELAVDGRQSPAVPFTR